MEKREETFFQNLLNSPGLPSTPNLPVQKLSSKVFSDENINIAGMVNSSKKDNAYTLLNTDDIITNDLIDKLKAIDGVIRIRVIK